MCLLLCFEICVLLLFVSVCCAYLFVLFVLMLFVGLCLLHGICVLWGFDIFSCGVD